MINWGIVGLGNMGYKFASSLEETNNSKLGGIASLNNQRLKNFQETFNIKNEFLYKNYNELIEEKNIDAIYIATLNNSHLELIKSCAKNKKNILCEKPITLNYEEAQEARDYINRNKVFFFEAIAFRSHPQTQIVREIINQNEIGDITTIETSFGFKVKKINPKSRLFNKDLGGGSILDLGCYPLSTLNFLFNKDSKYEFTSANGTFCSTNVDDSANAEILINNKVQCTIKVSIKENFDNKTVIKGTKGEIIINNPWLPEKKTTLDIKNNNSFYKKFINSDLSIFANQTQKVSENFLNKTQNDKFLVDIDDSLNIMRNLTEWSNIIKK